MKIEMELGWIFENDILNIVFEFFLLLVTLFSLAIIVEHFMIPCLQAIAKKYDLSEQSTGYILALGSAIPEFTTNLISATTDGGNVNVGIGTITGSGSFDFTVCFGIASLFTTAGGLYLNKTLYYRDSFIYLFSLTILTFFLKDNVITLFESLSLVMLFPIYMYISTFKLNHEDDPDEQNPSPFFKQAHPLLPESKELKPLFIDEANINSFSISVIDRTAKDNNQFEFHSSNKSNTMIHTSQINNLNNDLSNVIEDDSDDSELLLQIKQEEKIQIEEEKLEEDNIVIRIYNGIKNVFVIVYKFIFPNPETYPVLCFMFNLVSAYFHTRITLFIIEKLSMLIKLTASFLGMTLISWGGNVSDTVNASIATKIKAVDLLTTSILGSQVMNLHLCLGIPWTISIIKNYLSDKNMEIDFGSRSPLKFLLPLYLVILASIFIMSIFSVNLNRKSGMALIIVYVIYLVYEFKSNLQ